MVNGRKALREALLRTVQCPWPWALRYLLMTLPALALVMVASPLLTAWFRTPLLSEALETRSLDLLLEFGTNLAASGPEGVWAALALLALPIVWLLVRGLWLLVEGGALTTYASATPPTLRNFLTACWRWFGAFFLLSAVWFALVALLLGAALVLGLLVRELWRPASTLISVAVALGMAVSWIWVEVARAVAVVRDQRHVFQLLRSAADVLRRRALTLFGLCAAVLALRMLLAWISAALARAVPFSWWLADVVIQQIIQIAIVGLVLLRRAGEVGIVKAALTGEAQGGAAV